MANTLEYAIKIRDLTKQGLNSAKSGIDGFAKGTNNRLLGMFMRGGMIAGLAFLGKQIATWAKEVEADTTGAFNSFQKSGAKAFNNMSGFMSTFASEYKANVVGILGKGLSMLGIGDKGGASAADVERVKSEQEAKKTQIERIRKLQEERMTQEQILDIRYEELRVAKNALKVNDPSSREKYEQALNAVLDTEKKITAEKEKQQKIDDDAAEKANDAARQVDRAGGMLARGDELKGLALSTNARKAAERQGLNIERRDRKFDKLLASARDKMTDPVKLARGQKLTKSEILALQAEKLLVAGANDPGKVQEQQLRELQNLNTHVLHLMTQR